MMHKVVDKFFFIFCFFSVFFSFLNASSLEDQKKAGMIEDLRVIKHHFEAGYAPAEWKKEFSGWDLNAAFEKAKELILATPSITTKQFQQILRNFMGEMKDYHVDVSFFSTESASLPFSVKGIEERYFINWVDPIRLPLAYHGLCPGDELLEFDERPIAEVIVELEKIASKSSNSMTDRALAEMKLTLRSGKTGDIVPKGSILVTVRSAKNGKTAKHQLRWAYKSEYVKNPLDFVPSLDFISWLSFKKKEKLKVELPKIVMASPLHEALAQEVRDRDGALGGRKSFLPPFGEIIWSNEDSDAPDENKKDKKSEESSFWHAYVFCHPNGSHIGYVRIPHYMITLEQVEEFGKIMNVMDDNTDALIIDQVHNFGGFVHIQYLLASILTNQPLQTPYHRIKITQKDALEAYQTLELIKLMEIAIDAGKGDSNEKKENQEEEEPAVNFQELLFLKAYCELVLENWNNGQTLTTPTPILGVDKINPHSKYRYTKPVLMLIDEMDFSGGDFMPAILQDNKRALLFGARTAGAGGYVFSFNFPNRNGIASCSYTASIAERVNFQKIENLGVSPDLPYRITLDDVQNQYSGYIQSANQAINILLEENINKVRE